MKVRNAKSGKYMRVSEKETTAFLKCYADNHIEIGYDDRYESYKRDLEHIKRK